MPGSRRPNRSPAGCAATSIAPRPRSTPNAKAPRSCERELDGLGTSLEDERQTAGARRRQAEDLERTLTGERARVAVLESEVKGARHELEQAAATLAAERETAGRLQLEIEEVRKSLGGTARHPRRRASAQHEEVEQALRKEREQAQPTLKTDTEALWGGTRAGRGTTSRPRARARGRSSRS